MLAKRLCCLFFACCLLALFAGMGGHVVAQGGSASLVLKFPVVKDFGGVHGKVLYVKRELPDTMPLKFAVGRVEAVSGFFPLGRRVTVFSAGLLLGSAVVDEGQLSVAASFPPVDGALEVVESERELPVSGTCIKVKSTGGVLRALGGQTSNPWSPPPGTVRMLRAHVQPGINGGYPVYLEGWNGVSWQQISGWSSNCDVWVDIPPGIMQLRVRSPGWSLINVPEVEVEVQFVEDVVLPAGAPGVVQGPVTQVPTDGVPYLQASSHGVNLWGSVWSPTAKAVRVLRVWLEGRSERDWDYGYLYGWDGASWHLIAKRSGVYSEWVSVPPGITRLMVRLAADGSVLESPTYVHVRAAEVEWGSPLTVKVKSTGGVLRVLGGQTSNPWSPPPGTVRMLRAHVQVDAKPDTSTGYPVYLDGWDGVSWREISGWNFDCDVRVDIPPGMMQLRVRSPMWSSINVPEVEVEEEVSSP